MIEFRRNTIHLLLPFSSSILVILGLMYLKKAQEKGVSAWTVMIAMCWTCAITFPCLTLLGGTVRPISEWYQPAIVGGLFLAGQLLVLLAIRLGDVSIAAPVQGVKVLIVPAIAVLMVDDAFPLRIWIAATLAMLGIGFVQVSDGKVDRSRILASVVFALLGAIAMSFFDLCIQRWAPAWGTGTFLPIALAFSALFAAAFVPVALRHPAKPIIPISARRLLLVGCLLMAIQAIGMTVTLAQFGDATKVNIVYSLRGLWGVVIPWLAARFAGGALHSSPRVMTMRLMGAIFIGSAVIIAVLPT